MRPGPFDAWAVPAGALPGSLAFRTTSVGSEGATLRWPVVEPAAMAGLLGRLLAAGAALKNVPVAEVAAALGRVGARLADTDDSLSARARALLPAHAGLSPEQAAYVLAGMAGDWAESRLRVLLEAEFGEPALLDRFGEVPVAGQPGRRLRAYGPDLGVHVCASTVPGVGATSLVRGLLVKGPVLLKPGAGDVVLPVLFARALAEAGEVGRLLADATAVLYWPGSAADEVSRRAESLALEAADVAVVYGTDATVASVRARLAPSCRLVTYPHRISVAVVGRGGWAGAGSEAAATDLARAVGSFDQRGCVCPRAAFLVGAGPAEAHAFAERVAAALERLDRRLPPGPIDPSEAAAVQQLRGGLELRAASDPRLGLWAGEGVRWTVAVDEVGGSPGVGPDVACVARTVRLLPLPDERALERALKPVSQWLQSVGVTGLEEAEERRLAAVVGGLGAAHIAPLRELPFPPPWWMHDGRGPLRALVRWADWVR